MSSKRKYSFPYRVYRKIRYLRYVSKLRRAERKAAAMSEKEAMAESRKLARKQIKSESSAEKQKRKKEKLEIKEARQKVRADLQQEFEENREYYEGQAREKQEAIEKERQFRRYRKRKLTRFYMKKCRQDTVRSIKSLHPANLPVLIRNIRENKVNISEFAVISVHSILMFVAAYFMVFLIMLLTEAVSGLFFDYSAIIYYYEVLWLVKPEEWFQDSVQLVYASGPIFCGIIAVFTAIFFSYIYTEKGLYRLFILWFFIHAFNAFFGSLLIGSLFGRGFGYAIIWTYISDTEKVIYSIVSIIALILLGVFTTRAFLISANSYFPHLMKHQQRKFIWAQVLLPFLLGTLMIGLITLPALSWFNMTVVFGLIITIIPIGIGYRFLPSLYFEEDKYMIRLKLIPIALAVIFIVLYRLILGFGIRLG